MNEMLESHPDGQDEWPHVASQRASRWRLPQQMLVEQALVEELGREVVIDEVWHEGRILADAMSVTFE